MSLRHNAVWIGDGRRLNVEALPVIAVEAVGVDGDRMSQERLGKTPLLRRLEARPFCANRYLAHQSKVVGRLNDRGEALIALVGGEPFACLMRAISPSQNRWITAVGLSAATASLKHGADTKEIRSARLETDILIPADPPLFFGRLARKPVGRRFNENSASARNGGN